MPNKLNKVFFLAKILKVGYLLLIQSMNCHVVPIYLEFYHDLIFSFACVGKRIIPFQAKYKKQNNNNDTRIF